MCHTDICAPYFASTHTQFFLLFFHCVILRTLRNTTEYGEHTCSLFLQLLYVFPSVIIGGFYALFDLVVFSLVSHLDSPTAKMCGGEVVVADYPKR